MAQKFDGEATGAVAQGVEIRRMGPTEASYYLGARGEGIEGGVNDMYLHIGFRARPGVVTRDRVLQAWSAILKAHPLLSSTAEFCDYDDIRFRSSGEATSTDLHARTSELCKFESGRQAETIIAEYLNGPRTLSDSKLSSLVVSSPDASWDWQSEAGRNAAAAAEMRDFDFFLLSTHFLGDGMALHSTANEFFRLLSRPTAGGGDEYEIGTCDSLPPPMEDRLMTSSQQRPLGRAIARVDFEREQAKLMGGHAFPRARLGVRRTLVPTVSYPSTETKRILAACKAHGVSIAHAMFALANVAFIRSTPAERRQPELPVMLYSALNVRPYLRADPESDWYHIAIGIVLPSFLCAEASDTETFWHRARRVKQQTAAVVTSPLLGSRTLSMAQKRESLSIGLERAADEKKRATEHVQELVKLEVGADGANGANGAAEQEGSRVDGKKDDSSEPVAASPPTAKTPQTVLMGLSMLGNLDGMYHRSEYAGVELQSLTTGSRQRPGALLLFAYTFADKLWLSLGYDVNGFEAGVVERWWTELQRGVAEFLLSGP